MNIYVDKEIDNFITSRKSDGMCLISFDVKRDSGETIKVIDIKQHEYFIKARLVEKVKNQILIRGQCSGEGNVVVDFETLNSIFEQELYNPDESN